METVTVKELLTENRFWTFWSNGWEVPVYVQWNGKTKFKDIINYIKDCHEFRDAGVTLSGYERQIEIKVPHYKFD